MEVESTFSVHVEQCVPYVHLRYKIHFRFLRNCICNMPRIFSDHILTLFDQFRPPIELRTDLSCITTELWVIVYCSFHRRVAH